MKCINLKVPQFNRAAEEIGEIRLAKILDTHFPDEGIPTYEDIMSYVVPAEMKKTYDELSKSAVTRLAANLSNKFGVPVQMNSTISQLGLTTEGGVVVLNPEKATMETAFHEFAHPLVNLIKVKYPAVYKTLVNKGKTETQVSDLVDRLYPDYSTERRDMEKAVTVLGIEAAKQYEEGKEPSFFKKLWKLISSMVNDLLGLDNKLEITPQTTFGDVVRILVSDKQINLAEYMSDEEQRSAQDDFNSAYEQGNQVQREALDELRSVVEADFKLHPSGEYYISDKYPGVQFMRVTSKLKQDPAFAYEGPDSPTVQLSTDWGNEVDYIVGAVLTGKTRDEIHDELRKNAQTGRLQTEAINKVITQTLSWKLKRPNSVFLTQVVPFNVSERTAGAIDIIEITEDGTRFVLDTKSSKYTTNPAGEEVVSNAGNVYTRRYTRAYNPDGKKEKYSTKQKHQAQVSSYGGMLHSKGFRVDEYGIIPVHLSSINGNEVVDANLEPTHDSTKSQDYGFSESAKHFIPLHKDSEWEGNQVDMIQNEEARRLHDKVLILLEAEKQNLKQGGNTFSQARIGRINKIQEAMKLTKSVIALENFADELFDMFVQHTFEDGTTTDSSFAADTKDIFKRARNDDFETNLDKIAALNAIVERIELYRETLEDLRKFYYSELEDLDQEVVPNSPFDKIRQILDSFDRWDSTAHRLVKPAIALELSKVGNKDIEKMVREKVDKITKTYDSKVTELNKKYQEATEGVTDIKKRNKLDVEHQKRLAKEKAKFNSRIEGLQENIASEENIMSLLSNGFRGINMADMFFTPIGHLPNPIVNGLYKSIKREYAKVRQEMQEWNIHAGNLVKKFNKKSGFLNSQEKINNEMIVEGVNGKLYLAADIDYNAFNTAKREAYKKIKNDNPDRATQIKLQKEWIMANMEEVGEEDYTIKNPITGEEVVLRKGTKTILAEKQAELLREYGSERNANYQKAYSEWVKQNSFEFNGERIYTGFSFRTPSKALYGNTNFDAMYAKNKEYYDFLLSTLVKAHNNYPIARTSQTIYELPGVPKSVTDRILDSENVMKGTKEALQHMWDTDVRSVSKNAEEDAELYGIQAFKKGAKKVPIRYRQENMRDADTNKISTKDISRDLIQSIGVYLQASERYKVQVSLEPLAMSTLGAVKDAGEYNLTADGRKRFIAEFADMGINLERYTKKWGNNYTAAALEAFIDAEIYGVKQKKEILPALGKEIDAGKMANLLMKAMSYTSIAAKPLIAAANALQQNAVLSFEAAAGEFIAKGAYRKALWEYEINEPNFIADRAGGFNKSLIGQLIDLYDPMIGHQKDHFGRSISSSAFKRMADTSNLYYMMQKGEHQIYVTSMIAMLMSEKIKHKETGEEITLYDAYELQNGVIQLKEGYELPDGKMSFELKERMDMMNQRMHGVYNEMDRPMAERFAAGRLISMFRKFVVPGIKKRYKKMGVDHNTGTISEGYYNTFFRLAREEFSSLLKFVTLQENNLDPSEKANVKRFLAEAGLTFALLGIVAVLSNMYDDEDDPEKKRMLSYPLYLAFRLRSELSFYYSFPDSMRILRTPTIAYSQLERISKFMAQLFDPMAEYERDYGIWEKGDSKLYAKFLKVFGLNGYTTNPDIAYLNLKRFTGL